MALSSTSIIKSDLLLFFQVLVGKSVELHLHPLVLTHAGDIAVGSINVFTESGELTTDYSA